MIPFLFAFSNCCIIEIHISLFTFSPSALHYISNSHSLSHLYIRSYLLLLLLLLSPHNLFTFLPFYFFTFKRLLPLNCVPMQPLLRRDVSGTASGRSHRYVGTQFRAHRQGGKKHQNAGCNPERRTFRFVKYLSIVYGIVNFLPVCASTV